MFVFDLFEKKKQDRAAGRFVGGTSQDARVKNALDNAYRAVPAAKSPEEAALGYIDIQNSLNQKQDQVLDQQTKTNQQQTQQINDLVNDMRRKENDFRNLNAQIASMPDVTPQQAARMAQDIEAVHSSDKGQPVDVPNVVAKQTVAQPTKTVAAPGPGASVSQLANYQQAKDQGAATAKTTAKAPVATPQAAPAPATSKALGQMANTIANAPVSKTNTASPTNPNQPAPTQPAQPAQPASNVVDFAQKKAGMQQKVAGIQIDQPDLKVAEDQGLAGSDPTSIARHNIEQLSKAYMSDARSVKMQFTTGQDLALQNTQIHALVDVISNLPDGANKQALLVNLFSNRTFLIEWMFENILNKPAQATQRPDAGQLEMYEGDVVPMTQDQSVLQAYNDVLEILKASKTKQPDVVTMMRQDWASRYKQRFQISTAPDGNYYMLDKTTNQRHRLPDPRTFPMEEDSWHNGQNSWSSEHDQWAKESVEETRLTVGDPVVVTAPNEFEGKTGEIAEFSPSGNFVIVDLYNYGEHSMHLSDVEYNQYADEEVDEGWSGAVVAQRTGTPRTPYSVYIKGKKWKDFENDDHAEAVANKLRAKFKADGRDPSVITVAPTDMSEGVATADQAKKVFKDKSGKPVGEIGIDPESSPGNGEWYVHHYATGYSVVGFDSAAEAKRELLYVHKHPDAVEGHPSTKEQGVAEAEGRVDPILIKALNRMPDGLATHGEVLNACYDAYAMELGRMEMKSNYGTTHAYVPQLMDLYKQKHGLTFNEAGSPAQQAAIAVAMKKAGKKPKNESDDGDWVDDPTAHAQVNRSGFNKLTPQSYADKIDFVDRQLADPRQQQNWPEFKQRRLDLMTAAQRAGIVKEQDRVTEIKKGQKDSNGVTKCWPGYEASGTKKGKNGPVRNCVKKESVAEAETDYSKRRQRERNVDAGKPVSRQPRNPQTDYAKKRAKEKRDLERFGESTNYWTRLQNERNTKVASLVSELTESVKDIK